MNRSQIIAEVCRLVEQNPEAAGRLVQQDYPFAKFTKAKRVYTAIECTSVFVKDGFIDRYSGRRLSVPRNTKAALGAAA